MLACVSAYFSFYGFLTMWALNMVIYTVLGIIAIVTLTQTWDCFHRIFTSHILNSSKYNILYSLPLPYFQCHEESHTSLHDVYESSYFNWMPTTWPHNNRVAFSCGTWNQLPIKFITSSAIFGRFVSDLVWI